MAGENIALERQAQAVAEAWTYQGSGCELLDANAERLGLALDDLLYDRDRDITEGVKDAGRFALLAETLAVVADVPMVRAFHEACERWAIPAPGGASVTAVCFDTLGGCAVGPPDPQPQDTANPDADEAGRLLAGLGKGWARSVIKGGFRPGEFWHWSHASGKNAIGAAIIYCDGDRECAERLLLEMAEAVEGGDDDRRRWIQWAVPRNNIEVCQEAPVQRDHLDLRGCVLQHETERAEAVVAELVLRLRDSGRPRRVFSSGAGDPAPSGGVDSTGMA